MSYPQLLTPEEKLADGKARLGIPPIVVICGSTRFMQEMTEADLQETAAGKIVVKPGCNMKAAHPLWADPVEAEALKVRLDGLHRAKIRLADEVLVVGDYVGSSTIAEIAYARQLGKPVRFTHPEVDPGEPHPTTAHRRKETPVPDTTPAETTPARIRRGDLAIVERIHVTHAKSSRTESTEYTVMVVCSVTRDGHTKAVRDDRYASDGHNVAHAQPLGRMLGLQRVLTVSKDEIDVAAAVATARAHTYPDSTTPRAYDSLDEVREALRPHRTGGAA